MENKFAATFGVSNSDLEAAQSNASDESDDVVTAESSIVDGEPSLSEDTPPDSSETSGQASPEANSKTPVPPTGDKEVITVTDETGKRRRVEIDYSNKEATKKAHMLAAGARKWQADRDQALVSVKQKDTQLSEYKSNWDRLEGAYAQGKEQLFDLLEGRKGAFKEFIQSQVERNKFLERASPEELQALEARERADLRERELADLNRKFTELEKKTNAGREEAEMKELQSQVYPAFDKYRFAGKLGDEATEARIDKAVWNNTLEALMPYEEKGLLTPEIIERSFRNESLTFRKLIGQQAEKKVQKVVEQKSKEATENVQSKIKSNYSTGSDANKARDLLKNGDTQSIFKNWSTVGKFFSNK